MTKNSINSSVRKLIRDFPEYDIKQVIQWKLPDEKDLRSLITMPNIPKPLHGCLRSDAEVLTTSGWKRIDSITTNDIVATWDKDTEKIIWDHPYETIKKFAKQLVRIRFEKYKTFGLLVTPEHRLPVRKQTDGRKQVNGVRKLVNREWILVDKTAAKINLNSFQHFITAARNGTGKTDSLTDLERVYIAIQADGTLRYEKNGEYTYRFSFKKQRKKDRIVQLCLNAGVKFHEQTHGEDSYTIKNGYQRFDVVVDKECKNFWNSFDIASFGKDKAQQFLDEISLWDGSCAETCGVLNRRYVTTNLENAKFAQAVAVIAGATSSFQINTRDNNGKQLTCYVIDFLDRDYRATQSCVKEIEEFDDFVYCINVPTSYFVVRDADSQSVMITGNCAPRVVLGNKWWDRVRKACYAEAHFKCEICGARVGEEIEKRQLHCLERGTEVLTLDGWKPIETITTGDVVAQFSTEDDSISWVNPIGVTSHFEENIYRFGYSKGFSVGVSSGHRMLIQDGKTSRYSTVVAEELKVGCWKKIPAAGMGEGDDCLTADERLLIALQADGSIQRHKNSGFCQIRVKKARKIARLKMLAEASSFKTYQSYYESKKHGTYFRLSFTVPYTDKNFFSTFGTPNMSYKKAQEFVDELVKWDGWEGYRGNQYGRCYYTNDKSNIDFVQAVCAQAGLGSHLTTTNRRARNFGDHTSENIKPSYNLEIKKTASYGLQTMKKTIEPYNDDVFCITVPSSYFVARTKQGDVFITGNCHELYKINYRLGESEFVRTVGVCQRCHTLCIHNGRAITLYKQGNPLFTSEALLTAAEHAFTIISSYNADHADRPPIRAYATWLEYLRQPDLEKPMRELIEKYDIKFYVENPKRMAEWDKWQLKIGDKYYPTPYANEKEWKKAMEKASKADTYRRAENRFTGKLYDTIDEIIKNS